MTTKALLISTTPLGESDSLVRLFCEQEGELTLRARGLQKARSKLAHRLKPADELEPTIARGRGRPVLAGIATHHAHEAWRHSLDRLAFYWFMIECAAIGSGDTALNADAYRLIVNLLRSDPKPQQHCALATAFCLKLLALHGLLPDLQHCAIDGHRLAADEPVHLLPSGEGVIGLAAYNQRYARTGGGLPRFADAGYRHWLELAGAPLLQYGAVPVEQHAAALAVLVATRVMGDYAGRGVRSAEFLVKQWKLPSRDELQSG